MNFDTNKWKVYTWKHGVSLHWMINPGLVVNDLLLGQRVAKVFLEDKESDRPRFERYYIPCPHCEEIHDGRIWSVQAGVAFKNWFGLYCPNCGDVIPCLRNLLSTVILILLFPVLYFVKDKLKADWLEKQPAKYAKVNLNSVTNPFDGKGWLYQGLGWGVLMFFLMTFLVPLFSADSIELHSVLIAIPTWIIGGLTFGFTMKLIFGSRNTKHSG